LKVFPKINIINWGIIIYQVCHEATKMVHKKLHRASTRQGMKNCTRSQDPPIIWHHTSLWRVQLAPAPIAGFPGSTRPKGYHARPQEDSTGSTPVSTSHLMVLKALLKQRFSIGSPCFPPQSWLLRLGSSPTRPLWRLES
jgi:hypothetical protein